MGTLRYTNKTEKYARYRWDYAPQAIQTIFEATGLGPIACVADIGAGTGILTRHFVNKVQRVYAVEPDARMLAQAEIALRDYPSFCPIVAGAEATTLPDTSIDLIACAQAIHWFDAPRARAEFQRILKPGGWLAVLWNHPTGARLGDALQTVLTAENGWDNSAPTQPPGVRVPLSFYFGTEEYTRMSFPGAREETWEQFIGALGSDSHAPDETDPRYANFERAACRVFDALNIDGRITVEFSTELCLGTRMHSWA